MSDDIVEHREIITEVLSIMPEASRFEIIGEIYKRINRDRGNVFRPEAIKRSVENYSSIVRHEILACRELLGASELLSFLRNTGNTVFISSNTPQQFLEELIRARNWNRLIQGSFGYPRKKTDTIFHVLQAERLFPREVLIIGDGISDERSATETGCQFYKIRDSESLLQLYSNLRK